MFLRRSGASWEAWAPAKLNLYLEVKGKREDGYHEIVTLMTAVSVFDTLYVTRSEGGGIRLAANWATSVVAGRQAVAAGGTPWGRLPEAEQNLAVRAVELLQRRAGLSCGVRLRLVKRIPAEAGMGGASSDAAAALVAANAAFGLDWPTERLAELAAELGSDVPFFLGRGVAVCRGRGEQIEPCPLPVVLHWVIARPPVGLSTREVYADYRPAAGNGDIETLVGALRRGDFRKAGACLRNDLTAAACRQTPWIERLHGEMDRLDLWGRQMTGSGSSCFGGCRSARHARIAAQRLRARNVGLVFCARSVFAAERGARSEHHKGERPWKSPRFASS